MSLIYFCSLFDVSKNKRIFALYCREYGRISRYIKKKIKQNKDISHMPSSVFGQINNCPSHLLISKKNRDNKSLDYHENPKMAAVHLMYDYNYFE